MSDPLRIYVDNINGDDVSPHATEHHPVKSADRAFTMLPPTWEGTAEIIFANTGVNYEINARSITFGRPNGSGSSLIIRGAYADVVSLAPATRFTRNEIDLNTTSFAMDQLIGAVLTRVARGDNAPFGPAVLIRGNDASRADGERRITTLKLQRTMGPVAGDWSPSAPDSVLFSVQRPAVTLKPLNDLDLSSADPRSVNIAMIGIRIAPEPGKVLSLFNFRMYCDTCEFVFQRNVETTPLDRQWFACHVHTDSRIQGGIERAHLWPGVSGLREQAGVYIRGSSPGDVILTTTSSTLGGHLTFQDITAQVSQGARFAPKSLEALRSPIHILAGGQALGLLGGWGTATNRARIRNVPGAEGDGLRVMNGGEIDSTLSPLNLNIYGCGRDGVRIDGASRATFGVPEPNSSGVATGLVTDGLPENGDFGMNVRNCSTALVGSDTDLKGRHDVAIDGRITPSGVEGHVRTWAEVATGLSHNGSLVRRYTS